MTFTERGEVEEEVAQGPVKAIYEEIKTVLGLPYVPSVFRRLAAYPDYLSVAWRALHPNLRIVYAQRVEDHLRNEALRGMRADDAPVVLEVPEAFREAVTLFQDAGAKLLFAVAALRTATSGQQPPLETLSEADKRQVPFAAGLLLLNRPDVVNPDADGTPTILTTIGETLNTSQVPDEYRILAKWPDHLETFWDRLHASSGIEPLARRLAISASHSVLSLPFRMELTPHALRHAGLTEADVDDVRVVLEDAWRLTPVLMSHMAFYTVVLKNQGNRGNSSSNLSDESTLESPGDRQE